MPSAFGGIAAPSVGNAWKMASLHRTLPADAETDTVPCSPRRAGSVGTGVLMPQFTLVVTSQKLLNVFPLGGQPPKTPPDLTYIHIWVLLPAAEPGNCINRRTQTWPSAVNCEMEPHEEELCQRGHCILSPCQKLHRQNGSLETAQQVMTDWL
ncbi:hypothetical protein WISP_123706 [Willisornis vidua]|uniref:Uncharacterized protein n=1 Tax=Willisornis vidua TaxID=1566151 RepID=A0ABQ9CUN8_9PASS|nr:hypothetical protein WISP_123706 [Willisornis vidua]